MFFVFLTELGGGGGLGLGACVCVSARARDFVFPWSCVSECKDRQEITVLVFV